jgi:hypothetical protein
MPAELVNGIEMYFERSGAGSRVLFLDYRCSADAGAAQVPATIESQAGPPECAFFAAIHSLTAGAKLAGL